jgi:uncharacterized protein (UPF0261 family)
MGASVDGLIWTDPPAQPRPVIVLATLDTKPAEAAFLRDCIARTGREAWLVDLGIAGETSMPAMASREEVARAAGFSLAVLQALPKGEAMAAAADGGQRVVDGLIKQGAGAIIGIGGGGGTWLCTAVMRSLPLGFPKLMLSTVAIQRGRRYVGNTDIIMMPSITDVAGVNRILGPILANAAAAVCGMADGVGVTFDSSRPVIAMTMFGVTTVGGTFVQKMLAEAGCEVIVFHANGLGGQAMEDLARRRAVDGVLDWTTSELTDEYVGGRATAGPNRLEAAGAVGIPQLIVPGAIDVVNLGPPEGVPARFEGRLFHMHRPDSVLMRTDAAESTAIGAIIGQKISNASGPIEVVIPALGFSALDAPGQPFEDAAADAAFTKGLRDAITGDIQIKEIPLHINDEAFARVVVDDMLNLLGTKVPG